MFKAFKWIASCVGWQGSLKTATPPPTPSPSGEVHAAVPAPAPAAVLEVPAATEEQQLGCTTAAGRDVDAAHEEADQASRPAEAVQSELARSPSTPGGTTEAHAAEEADPGPQAGGSAGDEDTTTPLDTRRYVLADGHVTGLANTVKRYKESAPVVLVDTPFEERVERALADEQAAAERVGA